MASRVARWTPPLKDAIRLAWRPALAYLVFAVLGSVAMLFSVAWYDNGSGKDVVLFLLGIAAGTFGILAGQLISILRFRAFPVFIISGICMTVVGWLIAMTKPPGGEYVAVPLLFFCFAFPCGLLSLMHRYELFASFWPAVGWIGGVFIILNREHRVHVWEENKVAAWLPVPLLFLAGFLIFWLLYLAAKQAARVEMWQALSGAAARRVDKRKERSVSALPRKNLLPLFLLAVVLFGITAVLAPYLFRTGRGDRDGEHKPTTQEQQERPKPTPEIDAEGLVQQMQKLANAAKNSLPKLWPLLLLLILYRPAKRALLLTHLKAPIVPTPPSERIDNHWEYVRIAAEDAGVVPTSSDSIEQLVSRIEKAGKMSPALVHCAEIYMRTRYGFVVQPGDAKAMSTHASDAATGLRKDLGVWTTFKNLWRPLS